MKWSFFVVFLMLVTAQTVPDELLEIEKTSVIVNVHTNTLALIESNHITEVHPVATGKQGEETPLGHFKVLVKAEEPYYIKKNISGGSPDNPLGSRWIGFDANGTKGRTFGLHGTNQPNSIGYSVSLGCIRLANPTVEHLYEKLDIGSSVLIVDETNSFKAIGLKANLLTK
ncbi:L,D-transpeptidase [Bacillus sp. JCM 19041]|uniref:L,D-transpeptidase n=1 Tax=Bacillus sp. JCM 19041 TaxID=1460637 RepID=UPI0006D0EA60